MGIINDDGPFLEDFEKPKVVVVTEEPEGVTELPEGAVIDTATEVIFDPATDDEVTINEDASLPDAEALAKLSRPELEKMAKRLHLDGDKYTNRTELAKAIVAARK